MAPGEIVELDIEIWQTCIVVPAGYRLGIAVRGNDYENDEPPVERPGYAQMRGVGPHKHDDPDDRPIEIFGGRTTLHFDGRRRPYVLLPIIPPK
jgi:hypothetical protein